MAGATNISGGASRTFRPIRLRVWAIAAGGIVFLAFTALVLWFPLGASQRNPRGQEPELLWTSIVLGTFLGGMSLWMCLLAWQLSRMCAFVSPAILELRARRYEWFITNPLGFRHVRLEWSDIRGIRRWRISNPLAPRGAQDNYILYTNQGRFVLSNLDWPNVTEMAALISQNARRPIAASIAELPAEFRDEATPRPIERAKARVVRGLAWLSILSGALLLGLIGLCLIAGQPFRGSLAGVISTAIVLVVIGESLRRFRLE